MPTCLIGVKSEYIFQSVHIADYTLYYILKEMKQTDCSNM